MNALSREVTIQIILADCKQALKHFSGSSIDLIAASPPYADQRNRSYGGITPDDYVAGFLPIADELYRVLKPSGSFVLNIKECVVNGERVNDPLKLTSPAKRLPKSNGYSL